MGSGSKPHDGKHSRRPVLHTKKQNRARSRKNLLGAWGVEMVNVMVNVGKFGIVKVSSEGAMEGASYFVVFVFAPVSYPQRGLFTSF